MKVNGSDRILERGNIDNEHEFNIKASGKAFLILSSGLYSNKIGAVVREIACNAFDAHIAANKADIPFEVHLPNSIEPYFSVKDYGTGLSHENVIHLYSTYFESTKNQSNDQAGAFGLGSKSPFAYASSFTIVSIYNKVKRAYAAYIGEDDTPRISLLHTEKTKEENGIEIKVPVKDADFSSFKSNVKSYLRYFNPLPKINVPAFDWEFEKYLYVGNNWKSKSYSYSEKNQVIQGPVPYVLDFNAFDKDRLIINDDVRSMLNNLQFNLEFAIGEIDITPSRESISYNKATVTAITNRLEQVYNELKEQYSKILEPIILIENEWERGIKLRKFKETHRPLYSIFGKDLTIPDVCLKLPDFPKLGVKYKAQYKRSWTNKYISEALSFSPNESTLFFINDADVPGTWIKSYVETSNIDWKSSKICVITLNGEDLSNILKGLGNPPVIYTSTLNKPKTTPRTRSIKTESVTAFDINNTIDNKRLSFSDADSNTFPNGGYYLDYHNAKYMYADNKLPEFPKIVSEAVKLSLLDDIKGKHVLLLTRQQKIRALKKSNNWINIIDYIKEKLLKEIESNKEIYAKTISFKVNELEYKQKAKFDILWNAEISKEILKDTLFKKFYDTYDEYSVLSTSKDIATLAKYINLELNFSSVNVISLKDLYNEICQCYPLLSTINYWSFDSDNIPHYLEYIKLIEMKNKLNIVD